MDTTQVPAGYKVTELGVLPEEWEVKRLGDFVQITSGMSPSLFQLGREGKPYFKVEQLNCSDRTVIETPYHVHTKYGVPAGSIVFPKRGASIMLNKIKIFKKESFMDTNLMTLTTFSELNNIYLYYWLGYYKLSQVADTTSIPQINNKHINPIIFPFPPLIEQQAIAEALGEVDSLLAAQRARLAKQRAVKQGLLQGLLSGEKRLPGFAGEWEEKRLGELGIFRSGNGFPTIYQNSLSGIYPFFKVSDMNNFGNDTHMAVANNYINKAIQEKLRATIFSVGTIVFAKIGAGLFLEGVG